MDTHDELKILISAYYDGEASTPEKVQVEAHLKECESCRKYLLELQMLSSSLQKWSDEIPSPDLEQKIHNLSKEGKPMRTSAFRITQTVTSVLVVVFFAVITLHTIARHTIQARIQDAGRYLTSIELAKKNGKEVDQLALSRQPALASEALYATKAKAPALKNVAATLSDQFSTGQTSVRAAASAPQQIAMGKTTQYEPYYLETSYVTERKDEAVRYRTAGGFQKSEYDLDQPYSTKGVYPIQGDKEFNTEGYDRIYENAFLEAKENPLSTFSIDVDTASYSNVRRFLNNNQLPPADAVRIEEMVNYFTYDYPRPQGNDPFSITTEVGNCPWNSSHNLVMVGLQGKELDTATMVPSNLVFLIDVSGSMDDPQKLPLLKSAFRMMVNQLRNEERIAIVAYAGSAGLVLDSTSGYDRARILEAIDHLEAGGSTAGGEGIQLAYQVAKRNFIPNGNNRVILATDGDFNVGVSSDSELTRLIEEKRNEGIFLSVLGFGTGNYQDSKMEKLADKGNGNYYYIDTIKEAEKVLVKELGSLLFTIAKDVKVQIEFNPAQVKAYRLIGYENRVLAKEDFNDDTKDAGELGAGHTVTALYEIVPANSREEVTPQVDSLKYQQPTTVKPSGELMTVKLRYKEPKGFTSQLITKMVPESNVTYLNVRAPAISDNFRFASAVAEFGLLLRNSQYKGSASYEQVLTEANQAKGSDSWGYRSEFIGLVEKAKSLNRGSDPIPYRE